MVDKPFGGLFEDKPWAGLPETEEEDEQDFELPVDEEEIEEPDEDEVEQEEAPEDQEADEIPAEQNYELPETGSYGGFDPQELADEFDEGSAPAGFKQLFNPRFDDDLAKLTETPAKMVLPLVRARIVDAAYDEERILKGESLMSVFIREFDKRMISKDRKGRLEAVELIRGLSRSDAEGEEEAMM